MKKLVEWGTAPDNYWIMPWLAVLGFHILNFFDYEIGLNPHLDFVAFLLFIVFFVFWLLGAIKIVIKWCDYIMNGRESNV